MYSFFIGYDSPKHQIIEDKNNSSIEESVLIQMPEETSNINNKVLKKNVLQ